MRAMRFALTLLEGDVPMVGGDIGTDPCGHGLRHGNSFHRVVATVQILFRFVRTDGRMARLEGRSAPVIPAAQNDEYNGHLLRKIVPLARRTTGEQTDPKNTAKKPTT